MAGLGTFIAQTAVSGAALLIIQVFAVAVETPPWDGGIQVIGWPIGAGIVAVVTNSAVAVLGLPLRLIPATRRWLQAHGALALIAAAAGVLVIIASYLLGHPVVRPDDFGNPVPGFEPMTAVYLVGWFLTAFALVHTWPPTARSRMAAAASRTPDRVVDAPI